MLTYCLTCNSLGICSSDTLDYIITILVREFRNKILLILHCFISISILIFNLFCYLSCYQFCGLIVNCVNPPEPALQIFITFIHHSNILLPLLINNIKLRQYTSCLKLFNVSHSSLHEFI
jgi:hypothetical protein